MEQGGECYTYCTFRSSRKSVTDYDQEDRQKVKSFRKVSITLNDFRISLLEKGNRPLKKRGLVGFF